MSLTTEQIRAISFRIADQVTGRRCRLIKAIQDAIPDEERAIVEYTQMANLADSINKHEAALKLKGISLDEYRHKEILQEIAEGKMVEEMKPAETAEKFVGPSCPNIQPLAESLEEEECHCDTLKPMEKWLAEEDTEEQCHECILTPIAEYYLGALKEEGTKDQIKKLEEAWATADLLTIGKAMDILKGEVGESLKKRLITFDCLAQTYKPEAAEDNKQQEV